jgi:hypothetical protein
MTQQHHDAAAKPQAPVFTDALPEFPYLVYNHETRQTKPAKDKDDRDKLAKEGFVDEPFPPLDPDALTDGEVQQLQTLLAKAAKALAKLGKLSGQHEPDNSKAAEKAPAKK